MGPYDCFKQDNMNSFDIHTILTRVDNFTASTIVIILAMRTCSVYEIEAKVNTKSRIRVLKIQF